MLVGVGGTSKTGKVHNYYKCKSVLKHKSCEKNTVKKAWLEDRVLALIHMHVLKDDVINITADRILIELNSQTSRIPYFQKQLDDVQKRINNVLDAIEQGLFNASAKERLDALEAAKAEYEIALAKEKIEKPQLTKEEIVFWISKFKDGDGKNPNYRKSMIDIFINSIYLFNDKIKIIFNIKDGTRTVSLSELDEAIANKNADKASNQAKNTGSHLDDNAPPKSGCYAA
jgi:hypothetical protein